MLPKGVPLDLRFEELRPAKELLNVQLFGSQPTLAGLWQTAKTEAKDEIINLYPMLALSADTRAGSIQSATIFEFCHRLHHQYYKKILGILWNFSIVAPPSPSPSLASLHAKSVFGKYNDHR